MFDWHKNRGREKSAKPSLFILTPGLSPYRNPLFLLLSRDFNLTVVIGNTESNRPEWTGLSSELIENGVLLITVKGKMIRLAPDRFLHLETGFLTTIIKHKPDAVISVEMGFRSLCALLFCTVSGRPLWIWWGGTPYSERSVGLAKTLLRRVFVLSSARWISYGRLATSYLESIRVKPCRVVQLQNTVNDRFFTTTGATHDFSGCRPIILVVGQLVDRKGLQQLMSAVARASANGVEFSLKLVGSGHRRQDLEEQVNLLGLSCVEFLGGVDPQQLPTLYRGADVLLFPTLEDIWGLVVNEALLCGLPVVCSRYAGCAPELLDEIDIFDPLCPNDFDRAILRAVEISGRLSDASRIWPLSQVARSISSAILAQTSAGNKNG